MLTLTDNASTVVKTITGQTETPVEGGLRISGDDLDARNFAVAVAPAPETTDAVVEQDGATATAKLREIGRASCRERV